MAVAASLAQTETPPRKKPLGGRRTPRAGVYVRSGIHVCGNKRQHVQAADDGYEEKPSYVPAPILLAPTSHRIVSDSMVGLKEDPKAQEDAETYIRQYISFNRKQSERELQND